MLTRKKNATSKRTATLRSRFHAVVASPPGAGWLTRCRLAVVNCSPPRSLRSSGRPVAVASLSAGGRPGDAHSLSTRWLITGSYPWDPAVTPRARPATEQGESGTEGGSGNVRPAPRIQLTRSTARLPAGEPRWPSGQPTVTLPRRTPRRRETVQGAITRRGQPVTGWLFADQPEPASARPRRGGYSGARPDVRPNLPRDSPGTGAGPAAPTGSLPVPRSGCCHGVTGGGATRVWKAAWM